MSGPGALEADEVVRRLRTVDTERIEATAWEMRRAASSLIEGCATIRRLVAEVAPVWRSPRAHRMGAAPRSRCYAERTAVAAARSGKMLAGSLKGQKTHAVLHFDQDAKRFLVVNFHAEGRYAGDFATAFAPTPHQIDELLRRAATVRDR